MGSCDRHIDILHNHFRSDIHRHVNVNLGSSAHTGADNDTRSGTSTHFGVAAINNSAIADL